MINDGINDVPDKTIAIFSTPQIKSSFNNEKIKNILQPSDRKRDWFTSHFYRCLPLTIGNSYGFVVKSEFDFSFEWNGEESSDAVKFFFYETEEELNKKSPNIASHFGSGIITINPPFTLRTPPGVNLMTINPPNYILPNITVMTGVVEADNLRRNFTFNLKIQVPNVRVFIPAGTPLAGFIPIPRYYADSFKLEYAENIFNEDIIKEEMLSEKKANETRQKAMQHNKNGVDRDYYSGRDSYGNLFKDHQKP